MVLNPPSYSCPDDHSDLTGLVTGALSGDGLAVARFARAAFRLPARRHTPAPPQPFEVIVTCPGPAGRPRPHQLTCTGALDHAAPASTGVQPPATATITADVTFRGLTSGQTASVTVSATATGQLLASATVTPATDGTATRTLTITGLPATEPVTVLARGGAEQCRSSLGTGSAPPTLSCEKVS